jgi:hypothetical protein
METLLWRKENSAIYFISKKENSAIYYAYLFFDKILTPSVPKYLHLLTFAFHF